MTTATVASLPIESISSDGTWYTAHPHCRKDANDDPDVVLVDAVSTVEVEGLATDNDDKVDHWKPREPCSFIQRRPA